MKKVKNNGSQNMVFLLIAPIILIVATAIFKVMGPILKEIGTTISRIFELAFPNPGTTIVVLIAIIYSFALGFMTAFNMKSKREKEVEDDFEELENPDDGELHYLGRKVS